MRIPFLGGIGVPELIIILIVVLLIFGPKNLPKLGNAIGRTFKSMRDGMEGKKKDGQAEAASTQAGDTADQDKQQAAATPDEPAKIETVEETIIEQDAPDKTEKSA